MSRHRALLLIVAMALFPQLACQVFDFVISPAPTPARVPTVVAKSTDRPVPTAAAVRPTAAPSVPTIAPSVPPVVVAAPTEPVLVAATATSVQPSAAPPTVPNPCTNPEAIITSPSMDSTVRGMIEVRGSASRANLDYWKVEYRPNASTAFDVLARSEKPLIDGVLVRISTKTLPNGIYWLQLTVVGKDGNYGNPCQIRITVAN